MDNALEIRGITKYFGFLAANDHINLAIGQGEIHAILGENGAGKSTLMNILYGLYQPDAGTIRVYGKQVKIHSPREATALGIQMVHQHFMLGLPFTVAENLVLGNEPLTRGMLLDKRRAETIVRTLSARYGLEVNPNTYVENLSVGEMQRVEILKALYRQANILILDEPTAVLTPLETRDLFKVMQRLKEDQKTVIFITHKLREVMEVADRVTVLRQGLVVGTHEIHMVNETKLVEMMVGKLIQFEPSLEKSCPGAPVLQMRDVWFSDPHKKIDTLSRITLDIRAGEILGIAGVEGNGQAELVEILIGLLRPRKGSIQLQGLELIRLSPRRIMEAGVACIHEDRQVKGLIVDFSVSENLILGDHYYPPNRHGLMLNHSAIDEISSKSIAAFDIRPPNPKVLVRFLSGGNQQKLILARELREKNIKLLIASQPSRGLDVNATIFVHQTIRRFRAKDCAILLISADLDEIKQLSDRIAVLYRGEIVALGPKESFSDVELGSLMLIGHKPTSTEVATYES
ncbi:MAG: ABC transporter ATP-binding protein [Anaerolineales bacterium]|nr:ABC transporter ATP-binding protein [Anaerolineales bacterium]